MRERTMVILLALPMMAAGCASESIPGGGSSGGGDAARGGKADGEIYGSCADTACGEQSTDGTCWCDDECVTYDDCCEDRETYCGGGECPATGIVCAADCPDDGRLPGGAPCQRGEWNASTCSCDAAMHECPLTGVVCSPDCPADGRLPGGAPCEYGDWNESTCSCDAPADCLETGCDDGDYCSFCWGTYQCIPEGAVC